MKKLLFTLTIFLCLLVMIFSVPAVAMDSNGIKNAIGFSIDSKSPGIFVEKGSTIHHQPNGITNVYQADGKLKLSLSTADSASVSTPAGMQNANQIYHLPDNSRVEPFGKSGAQVFSTNGDLVLTVINDGPTIGLRATEHDWVRSTSFNYAYIDSFSGVWTVPSPPPNEENTDYFFLGTQGNNGAGLASIVQPVLQWNQAGYEDSWWYQSWALTPAGTFTGTAYQTYQGYQCYGSISYSSGLWTISTWRYGGSTSTLVVSGQLANLGVNPFLATALEVWKSDPGTFVNDDVPGTCYFYSLNYVYNGQGQPIAWTPHTHPEYTQLTTPTLTYQSSPGGWVTYTTNY